jgi:predicted ATPase
LDWSHSLLTEFEQLVLRRLSVFVGIFTLEAARSVASDDRVPTERIASILAGLVAKSLVAADTTKFPSRYRLLDTTRAYTLQKLEESGEADPSTRRHALYFQQFLSSRRPADELRESKTEELHREYLGNVRAALEWAFSSSHDRPIAVALAAAAARFFIGLSLLTECAKWSAMAIAAVPGDKQNSAQELELQSALGLSLMFSRGNSPEAGVALGRALAIAEQLGDFPNQLRLLGRLHIFHERIGEYYAALRFAQRGVAVAAELGDPIGIAEAHSAIGISRHLEGDQVRALAHLEAALVSAPATENIDAFHFGFDFRNRAKIARARVQWLLGYPDQAVKTAIETVNEASTTEHPITHCIALIWAVNIFTWCGNLVDAEDYIDRFIDEANRHSLMPYQAVGRGVKAELAIKSGNAAGGVEALQRALEAIHLNRYELMTSEFSASLAEGLLATGRAPEALSTIQIALQDIDKNGDLFMKPEVLRVQGNILAAGSYTSPIEIEVVYTKATRMAEAQGALALALRGATSLAIFLNAQGRLDEAQEALIPIYMRFNEGFETSDLKAARRVLDQLVEL